MSCGPGSAPRLWQREGISEVQYGGHSIVVRSLLSPPLSSMASSATPQRRRTLCKPRSSLRRAPSHPSPRRCSTKDWDLRQPRSKRHSTTPTARAACPAGSSLLEPLTCSSWAKQPRMASVW